MAGTAAPPRPFARGAQRRGGFGGAPFQPRGGRGTPVRGGFPARPGTGRIAAAPVPQGDAKRHRGPVRVAEDMSVQDTPAKLTVLLNDIAVCSMTSSGHFLFHFTDAMKGEALRQALAIALRPFHLHAEPERLWDVRSPWVLTDGTPQLRQLIEKDVPMQGPPPTKAKDPQARINVLRTLVEAESLLMDLDPDASQVSLDDVRSPTDTLLKLCRDSRWGAPRYDVVHGAADAVAFKVTVPGLAGAEFVPTATTWSANAEVAKNLAAHNVVSLIAKVRLPPAPAV